MKKIAWPVIVLWLVFAGSAFAADYTIKVTAAGDYQDIYWSHAGQYDHWTENNARNEAYFGASASGGNVYVLRKDTLMNLSLPAFTNGETIEQASFYYYPLIFNYPSGPVNLYHGNDYIPNVLTAAGTWIGTDVTSLLKADQNAGITDLQFSMRAAGTISTNSNPWEMYFASGADQDFAPYLQLRTSGGPIATPEPVSAALFLLGGGFMALRRYRRKKKTQP